MISMGCSDVAVIGGHFPVCTRVRGFGDECGFASPTRWMRKEKSSNVAMGAENARQSPPLMAHPFVFIVFNARLHRL
jgi:hypothetical protein